MPVHDMNEEKKFKSKLVSKKAKLKVIKDHAKTCDNIRQWTVGAERMCEVKIVNNWKKDTVNIWGYKRKRGGLG